MGTRTGTGKCKRKWKHEHTGQGTIRVFSSPSPITRGTRDKGRFVVIADDGSICNKHVAKPDIFIPESWVRRVDGINVQVQR